MSPPASTDRPNPRIDIPSFPARSADAVLLVACLASFGLLFGVLVALAAA